MNEGVESGNYLGFQCLDLKTFAENEFDPKKWINKAWNSSGNQEKEVFVANAVSRLQLYMKQLTNSLDETTTLVVTSVPRVVQEATGLQDDGAALQQQLTALQHKVEAVEAQTGSSIESLQRIDKLKSRLENAASTLQEADKWAALTASLEELLETGVPTQGEPLSELAQQVAAMTQSLEVLSDAPDYDRKRLQLETLYNRLEAALSPPLIEALTQMDSGRTATYVAVFQGMARMMSVCRCWRRAAAARLSAAWQRIDAHSVPALSRLLVGEATKQVDWLSNVLKSERPLAELVRLYTDLLLSLEPSPTKLTSAAMKLISSPEQGINVLTDLRTNIDEFVTSIRNIIEAPRSNKETLYPPTVREFGRAAYAPLRELLPKYTEFQTQILLNHLKDPVLKQDDILEHARGILSLAERCDGWLTNAHSRGRKIAGIAVYSYHAPALENFMKAFSSHISAHSRRIEQTFLASVSAGQAAGVLTDTFPAALALQASTAMLLDMLAARHSIQAEEEVPAPKSLPPLEDIPLLLLEADGRQKLATLRAEIPPSVAALRRTKEQLQSLAKSILRQPVDSQLDKIAQLPVWSNNDALTTDLPDFALSPQEYITEIGQYLMTLPQHLEMHLSEKQAPWQFLTDVCVHTCNIYAEKILSIKNMDELGTKRCLTDITYLASVVEDLGSSITPSLKSLESSLRATTPSQLAESQHNI